MAPATSGSVESERAKRLIAMGQMAASLAHEIRNPLGSMELYCTLLKKDLATQSESLQLAEQIHSGIRTLDRIITNCLQFSRDVKPRYVEVDSTEGIFSEIVSYVKPQLAAGTLGITVEEEGDSQLVIDPHLVKQALANVVMNAVEAMTDAGVEGGSVEIKSDRRDPSVWKVLVQDDGPGIEEEKLETIFEPFVTTKEGGTGLGLPIVHSVVAAHGGKVTIGSKSPHGTTVSLEFPNFER